MTVFLAGSALGILEHLEAYGLAEIAGADAKGRVQQIQQIVVGRLEYGETFASGQGFVLQGLVGKPLKIRHASLLRVGERW
jgi:hypothetical protein